MKRGKLLLERGKNLEFYETLPEELRLEDEHLRMTSENFEKIFQLTKDEIINENTKVRDPILPITCSHNWLFINRGIMSMSIF